MLRVMAGLDPVIHDLFLSFSKNDVDARHRRQVYVVCEARLLWPGMTI